MAQTKIIQEMSADGMGALHPLMMARIEREGCSETNLGRRMRGIESDLYFALEARGHTAKPGAALVNGEQINFYLYQAARRTRVALKPKDWGYRAGTTTWEQVLVPSGRPTLVAKPAGRHGGGERRWTDKGQPLEAQIDRLVTRFEAIANAATNERADSEERARETEKCMRRAARRWQRELEAEERPETLRTLAEDWHEAQHMRAFLAAAEARLDAPPSPLALAKWMEWARQYVEALDPLSDDGLRALQAQAEVIEWDAVDDGECDPEEEEWRVLGMLDEYM